MVIDAVGELVLQRAFQAHDIGFGAAEKTNLFVPHTAMLGIFERTARHVGARDFGLRVGERMPYPSYGPWAQYCGSAPTLGEAINRMCDAVHFQQAGAVVTLEREGGHAVLRHYAHTLNVPHRQHSDHLLFPLLHFARLYLGTEWRPAWFELNYPRDADAGEIESRLPAPVRFGTRAIGIAMPATALTAPRIAPDRAVTFAEIKSEDPVQFFNEPLRSIAALAMLRLMEGKTDIDGTAQLAGISARTLQRSLSDEGLSYRALLDHIRTRRAKQLLDQPGLTVTQVALALGYSEHANFTRAFTRWTGQSPLHSGCKTPRRGHGGPDTR
ncbi:hypothetical protein AUC68_00875 [Methyloceanibacter methanicus]|uniref:HTH araC/xylS-type domain-containing protein n=2 Tax=Methyloceanibacter methanicus TaxID=1774968 RepID=A0A1E3W3F6_9HYPH|nr:hypothetical protein AUC68_00875 [Methyloceanibacter methanicus]